MDPTDPAGGVVDPFRLRERLLESGWDETTLTALVACEDDCTQILERSYPGIRGHDRRQMATALWQLVQEWEQNRSRKIRATVQRVRQPRLGAMEVTPPPGEIYDAILAENIDLARSVFKSRHKRALRQDGSDQKEIEFLETKRWALSIAAMVKQAGLPATQVAEQTADPQSTWMRLCGNRRARTLRQTARTWVKVVEWLGLTFGEPWPSSASRIIDYLEERAQEGCGHTVPGSVLAALQLMESIGGVEKERRLGCSPMLNNVVRSLTRQLGTDAVPKRTAPMYTVAMVLAAEVLVVDEELGPVTRVLGFIFLLMIWAALRTDDVLWVDRSRLILSEIGLRGVLIRSKTSGAGRRVRELPFFVVRTASLSGHDWLGVGMDLYLRVSEFFPGVQCLCPPRKDLDGFTRRYLEAATLMGWIHWLILQLRVPKKVEREWTVDPDDPLIDPELGTHWSGHSARHCLPSWAAAVGVDSDRRAFIGRWRAGVEVDHNAYVLTARQVVHGVQEEVLQAFCTGKPRHYLEVEVINELVKYGEPRGVARGEITKRHMVWRRKDRVVALFQNFPMIDREIWAGGDFLTDELENPVVTLEGEEEPEATAPYWVSISRKTGFRRLHKMGGCGISPDSVFRSELVATVNKDTADKKCRLCWKQAAEKADSDSTSGTSSSTETESDRDEAREFVR